MAHQTAPPPVQRAAVLVAVFLLHVCLLLLLLATGGVRLPATIMTGTLSVVSIAAEAPAATPPPPPALPSEIAETNRPLTDLVIADEFDPNATATPAGGCATLKLVSDALLADPDAMDAILRAPPEARSIADAIVVWNAGWSAAAGSVDSPLGAVRAVAEQSLRAVDEGCLDEPIAGPRLIAIPAGERTTFIVFGSGNWSWRELLEAEDNESTSALPGSKRSELSLVDHKLALMRQGGRGTRNEVMGAELI